MLLVHLRRSWMPEVYLDDSFTMFHASLLNFVFGYEGERPGDADGTSQPLDSVGSSF